MNYISNVKISVIVPVYKIEYNLLNNCLNSLLNQTLEGIEVLIIDDGSPDDCGRICDDYAKKYKNFKVFHEKNGGVSKARNIGISHSNGKYLCFVDPDDSLDFDMLNILFNISEKNKSDLSICNFNYGCKKIQSNIKNAKVYTIESEAELNIVVNSMLSYQCEMNITGAPWAKLYLSSIIKNNSCFFDESLPRSQDNEFNIRYMQYVKKCIYIDSKLYNYTVGTNSAMRKYWKNAIQNATHLLKTVEYDINEFNKLIEYQNGVSSFWLTKIEDVLYTNLSHPDNKLSLKESSFILEKLINDINAENYISKINYNRFGIYRKLLLFTLKHKKYILVIILGKIRLFINRFR